MSINLSSLINIVQSKANEVTSSTRLSDLYKITIQSDEIESHKSFYDSVGDMPIDAAYVGSVMATADGNAYILDSANGAWQTIVVSSAATGASGASGYGYVAGGQNPPVNTLGTRQISRFPFQSELTNATTVGSIYNARRHNGSSQSSSVSGYMSGTGDPGTSSVIEKYPFSADADVTGVNVGNLATGRYYQSGQQSSTHGYSSGGVPTPSIGTQIEKFPFATDDNTSAVGDLEVGHGYGAGHSSSENGYTSGGWVPPYTNAIQKFPFATDTNATNVATYINRRWHTGLSSSTDGYSAGGLTLYQAIWKFPFASDTNAVNIGNLISTTYAASGQSSLEYGYVSGGNETANIIQRFPFAVDANSVGVGVLREDLRRGTFGHQYNGN